MSVMQATVIKNGKDISNTEEGKAILERLKNFFNIIGLIFTAIFSIFCTGFSNIISYISGGIK